MAGKPTTGACVFLTGTYYGHIIFEGLDQRIGKPCPVRKFLRPESPTNWRLVGSVSRRGPSSLWQVNLPTGIG